MARKLTTSEKTERQIIKDNLNRFGYEVTTKVIKDYARENTGRLKRTMNFAVKPYNVVTFSQVSYGKYTTFKDKPTTSANPKDKNPLLQTILKEKGELQNIIIKDLKESILYPFTNGSNTNNNK